MTALAQCRIAALQHRGLAISGELAHMRRHRRLGRISGFPDQWDWLRLFSPFPVFGKRRKSPAGMRLAGTTAQPRGHDSVRRLVVHEIFCPTQVAPCGTGCLRPGAA